MAAPLAYIHPRGVPSQAIRFDLWERYKSKLSTITSSATVPGLHTEIIQSIGKKAPTFSFSATFDEWATAPGPGAPSALALGLNGFTGAHLAWAWLHEWLGDDGTSVDNVFTLSIAGVRRDVVIESADPELIQATERGYVLRFKCEFSGKFYTETQVDPAMFGKARKRGKKRKKKEEWSVFGGPWVQNGDFPAPLIPDAVGNAIDRAAVRAISHKSTVVYSSEPQVDPVIDAWSRNRSDAAIGWSFGVAGRRNR